MARSAQQDPSTVSFHDKPSRQAEKRLHQFKQTASQLEKEMELYWHQTEGYIRKNPVKSTVIAGAVGILLGKLISK